MFTADPYKKLKSDLMRELKYNLTRYLINAKFNLDRMVPDGDSVWGKGRRSGKINLWYPRGWSYTGWLTEVLELVKINP